MFLSPFSSFCLSPAPFPVGLLSLFSVYFIFSFLVCLILLFLNPFSFFRYLLLIFSVSIMLHWLVYLLYYSTISISISFSYFLLSSLPLFFSSPSTLFCSSPSALFSLPLSTTFLSFLFLLLYLFSTISFLSFYLHVHCWVYCICFSPPYSGLIYPALGWKEMGGRQNCFPIGFWASGPRPGGGRALATVSKGRHKRVREQEIKEYTSYNRV